jgi:hypothetical protein
MGHSSISTTQIYLHADEDAKRDAVHKLSKQPPVSQAAREAVENLNAIRHRVLEKALAEQEAKGKEPR